MKNKMHRVKNTYRVEYATHSYAAGTNTDPKQILREDVAGLRLNEKEAIRYFEKEAKKMDLVLMHVQKVIYWRPVIRVPRSKKSG